MKLSIGIVGLPNVGKSTLFKILTKNEVNIANYPFCTIDPNVGIVPVPDERVDKLVAMSKSKKRVPAIVEFYDIAGLVKGASTGEGLGNKFLSHIRECSAIVEVLRCFGGSEIIHVENTVDPLRDMDIINTELVLKDLDTVAKRMESAGKEARGGKKEAAAELVVLEKAKARLEKGELILDMGHEPAISGLQLLSAKPQIYLLNGVEADVPQALKDKITALGASYLVVDVGVVSEIPELVREAYKSLNLISFFTTGEDETRAWTIERGMKAPQAAGVIHTDFEKKFIRMETINWQKLLEAVTWSAARQKGWLRQEGKEYVVQDGDVVEIKHG
ncbi:MAG: redox-regulated ATPase YchF [bacterium]|nr:redox-regulated ATPase YchF [bacterium]